MSAMVMFLFPCQNGDWRIIRAGSNPGAVHDAAGFGRTAMPAYERLCKADAANCERAGMHAD